MSESVYGQVLLTNGDGLDDSEVGLIVPNPQVFETHAETPLDIDVLAEAVRIAQEANWSDCRLALDGSDAPVLLEGDGTGNACLAIAPLDPSGDGDE